ncbi:MAG TPA: cob(I)yrinic acid a,c-diamide adenosyltransferase [Fibrobacteres bacterium]|jgi:cob(I)alamin adenosyltransferase|nr:cob(I)yrinic acid a,c-diamide adenosyltransferase [Fibrobacterota bacterium]
MSVRINRVYTRSGDDGTTALIGGVRVSKDHIRVEAYGCVDELNSFVGLSRSAIAAEKVLTAKDRKELENHLRKMQNQLFDLGSVLSAPQGGGWEGMPLPGAEAVAELERSMDAMQKSLKPLESFVLPGGSWPNAWLHVCRTACRRVERRVLTLSRAEKVPPEAIRYLNRLSDWFFVAARYVAHRAGATEYLWEYPEKKKKTSATRKSRSRSVP